MTRPNVLATIGINDAFPIETASEATAWTAPHFLLHGTTTAYLEQMLGDDPVKGGVGGETQQGFGSFWTDRWELAAYYAQFMDVEDSAWPEDARGVPMFLECRPIILKVPFQSFDPRRLSVDKRMRVDRAFGGDRPLEAKPLWSWNPKDIHTWQDSLRLCHAVRYSKKAAITRAEVVRLQPRAWRLREVEAFRRDPEGFAAQLQKDEADHVSRAERYVARRPARALAAA